MFVLPGGGLKYPGEASDCGPAGANCRSEQYSWRDVGSGVVYSQGKVLKESSGKEQATRCLRGSGKKGRSMRQRMDEDDVAHAQGMSLI